jgi:tetratricopeptide (TPR) repeat protein
MKSLFVSALMIAGFTGTAHAESTVATETAYPAKAIGYDALTAGDNVRAVDDMMNGSISRHDPAFLLNLGQAYARIGRITEALEMFRAAARKSENVDLVLADGRVIGSKQAARQALATVQVGLAAR